MVLVTDGGFAIDDNVRIKLHPVTDSDILANCAKRTDQAIDPDLSTRTEDRGRVNNRRHRWRVIYRPEARLRQRLRTGEE